MFPFSSSATSRISPLVLGCGLVVGLGMPNAQATTLSISNGLASFLYDDTSTAGDSFVYGSSGDTLYQEGWYLSIERSNGRRSATLLTRGSLTSTSASTKTITYSPGGQFSDVESVAITYSIVDTGSAGILNASVEVAAGGSGANFSLINYFDYDLGNAGNDSASFDALNGRMTITDGDSNPAPNVTRQGSLFDSWEIAPYSALESRIANGQLLSGSGSPFGPADFTGAMQWNFALGSNQSQVVNIGGGGAIGAPGLPEISHVAPLGILIGSGLLRRRR